eukprot:scaffold7549_cov111-Isochrysis_galbana.AAC.13
MDELYIMSSDIWLVGLSKPIFGLAWAWSRRPLTHARASPSASVPNDVDMGIASSPKRPRDPAQDNKVSPRATPFDPAMLENQIRTTEYLSREPARAWCPHSMCAAV